MPPKKQEEKKKPEISFSIETLRRMDWDAIASLMEQRIKELHRHEELKVGYQTYRPSDELARWFTSLPAEHFAGFFEATTWPPKRAEEQREREREFKQRAAQRRKPKITATSPRAKGPARAKLHRDVKPANMSTAPTKPVVVQGLKPRKPPRATGDQLAADGGERAKVLECLRRNPGVSAGLIERDCALTAGQTKGLLKRLRAQGAIRVDGKNKAARYSLASSPATPPMAAKPAPMNYGEEE